MSKTAWTENFINVLEPKFFRPILGSQWKRWGRKQTILVCQSNNYLGLPPPSDPTSRQYYVERYSFVNCKHKKFSSHSTDVTSEDLSLLYLHMDTIWAWGNVSYDEPRP